jgi:hypothetical protein
MAQLKVRYLGGVQEHHSNLAAFWFLTATDAKECVKVTYEHHNVYAVLCHI